MHAMSTLVLLKQIVFWLRLDGTAAAPLLHLLVEGRAEIIER